MKIAIRLPAEQLEAIDRLAENTHSSRSDLVRRAIKQYLYRLACEEDAAKYDAIPLTEDELAMMRDPDIWKTAPPW